MSLVTITQAAELAGISRSHFHRHYVKSGKISVKRDKNNKPQVDTAEILRVFGELKATAEATPHHSDATAQATPPKHHTSTPPENTQNLIKIAELETENRILKQQLEKAEQQETWYKQQMKFLEHQKPPRLWWQFWK